MAAESMEDKLWTVSNGVTGFAILQSVAFIYAATGKDLRIDLTSPLAKWGMALAGIACGAVYCLAVWRAYRMALTLRVEHKQIWREVTYGRLLAIVVFQALNLAAILVTPMVREPSSDEHSGLQIMKNETAATRHEVYPPPRASGP